MRWEAPARCGCVLDIEAEWVHEPEDRAGTPVQHAYPVTGTIRSIGIITVCPAHQSWQTDPLPPDPYGGASGYLPLTTQTNRQVTRLPADRKVDPATATPAQRVFVRHFMFPGAAFEPDTCGCRCYLSHQRGVADSETFHDHPKHSRRCRHHASDVRHQTAIAEHRMFHKVREDLMRAHPELVKRVIRVGDAEVELDAQTESWARNQAQAGNPFAKMILSSVPEERLSDGVTVEYDDARQVVVRTGGRVQAARLRATANGTGHGARVTVID